MKVFTSAMHWSTPFKCQLLRFLTEPIQFFMETVMVQLLWLLATGMLMRRSVSIRSMATSVSSSFLPFGSLTSRKCSLFEAL